MFNIKAFLLNLLLTFLLFVFLVNSIYSGIYAIINPFLYLYFGITLILLYKIAGIRSVFQISATAVIASSAILLYQGNNGTTGYFNNIPSNELFVSALIIQLSVFIIIPYVFSVLISKKYSLASSIYYPVIITFFIIFSAAIGFLYYYGINVYEMLHLYHGVLLKNMVSIYKEMGVAYLTTEKMHSIISKLLMDVMLLMPSIIVTFSWMGLWLGFIILRKFNNKKPDEFFKHNENLTLWKSSDFFLLFLITGIAISIFSNGLYKFIGYNIILLSSSVYLVQGLTIVSFFFNKLNLNLFLRVLTYILIVLFNNPLVFFVIFMGIFDMWFNFRKLEINKGGIN